MDTATFAMLNRARTLELRIPARSEAGCGITTVMGTIDDIETAGRRGGAVRAAEGTESSDDDLSEDDFADEEVFILRVRTLPVASSIGGKIWDASLLMSAWLAASSDLFPPPPGDGQQVPRLLEVGSGLGLVGLAASMAFPSLRVTLSDYDPAVVDNLHESVRLTFPSEGSGLLDVATVDIRDFSTAAVGDAVPARYASLRGQIDMIIASDVVYESSHCQLAQLCLTLLAPASGSWQPCAVFLLPDSRPRLREFTVALTEAGLACRIERVLPSAQMVRCLRRAHDGWGAEHASFSLYWVTRGAEGV